MCLRLSWEQGTDKGMAWHETGRRNRADILRNFSVQKKSDVKESTEWRNLFASIVQNTSMTMEDIGNLRINQLEDLLEGMSENAEELDRKINGKNKPLTGDAALKALSGLAMWGE